MWRAGQTGVRLLIPLTDNYGYYHGGKHDFVKWVDPESKYLKNCVLPLCVKEPAASLCPFYTNRTVIDAFKNYIHRLLNHVNQYTGTALKDDPAILGWETGNIHTARSRNAVMVAKCPAGFLPKKPSTGGGPAASSWDKVYVLVS